MAKSKNKIRVSFCGENSYTVTGSCIHIKMDDCQILLESGLYQGKNTYEDYKINTRKFDFKPKEIDFIFVNHAHIDHIGRLPRLYAQGCKARIIAPKGTVKLFSIMGADSAFIMSKDVELFKKKYNKEFNPIYTQEDVDNCLKYFEEYDFGEKIKLTDNIEFCFQPSGHIISSAQLELWLTQKNNTRKIVYTSDIGNIEIPKYYINEFKPIQKANLVIGESTYSDKIRSITIKDRNKDLEKIKSVINTVCIENKAKVLIPVFALDRLQNILTHLYNLYGENNDFNIPILVDTPLGIALCNTYKELLVDEQLELFNKVVNWKNIVFINSYEDSKSWMESSNPCVILSCSGMLHAGRSRTWVSKILPNSKNHILFCGFSVAGSLADKIKNSKQKTFTIDGIIVPNRCGITDLKSFSSHIQRDAMIKYYSDFNTEKIALVHGDINNKIEFAKDLKEEISRKNKTTKVVVVNKRTELLI